MYTIYGIKTILVVKHLTIEQVGTFMARNGNTVGNVLVVNENNPKERSVYYV